MSMPLGKQKFIVLNTILWEIISKYDSFPRFSELNKRKWRDTKRLIKPGDKFLYTCFLADAEVVEGP